MNIKRSILLRIRIAFLAMLVFAIAIIVKLNIIQFKEGDKWRAKANEITYDFRPVKAKRGNIYSDNGSLLATSLPFYRIAFDPTVASDKLFISNVDSLAYHLSRFFGEKSQRSYLHMLKNARAENRQYLLISKRELNYHEKKQVEKWPLFRSGRYGGGAIFEKVDERFRPFANLSSRTVGFINENNRGAGLEYSFNNELAGTDGGATYQKISGGSWKPLFDGTELKAEDGVDIKTTIDVNLQDVAETALRKSLTEHDAEYGLVVVMEVKTGHIKAISNLTKRNGSYIESYNHAVGGLHEPGSTFKLATMLALLEDTPISLSDSIDTGDGTYKVYNNRVRDHHQGGWGKITIQEAFEKSSNVAMSKLVEKYYALSPNNYLGHLDRLQMTKPLNFQIKGEGKPKVIRPGEPGWSGITLPWMAYGYGLEITPLHTLTLFNAVANDGKMIKPIIVNSIGKTQSSEKVFKAEVLNEKICSDETLTRLRTMLEGVVLRGTAENIKGAHYQIAGKTGTAQILSNGRYTSRYITSFAGYFPASNPKYSAIVLIKDPKGWRQYGSNVAAPVFKEVADNIYARDVSLHAPFEVSFEKRVKDIYPVIRSGNTQDLHKICNELGVANHIRTSEEWSTTQIKEQAVLLVENKMNPETVPDVSGMTLRDALYVLESRGLNVRFQGMGRVKSQSLAEGRKINKGQIIQLDLEL